MDEEDGRLGPTPGHIIGNVAFTAPIGVTALRARQVGRADALTDASTKSLRHPKISKTPEFPKSLFWDLGSILPISKTQPNTR